MESRDIFDGYDSIPRPGEAGGYWSAAGKRVDSDTALGLPAALAAVRLLAEAVASMPLVVHRVEGDVTERAPGSWQWRLVHDEPNPDMSPFQVWSHVVASLNTAGNALLLKGKSRGRVAALWPLPPSRFSIVKRGGRLVFRVRGDGGVAELGSDQVLHVPGILVDDPQIGVSPVAAHRNALGTALALEEFQGRFFENDASPGGLITTQGPMRREQRELLREAWEARHRGGRAAGRVAVLDNGASFEQIGLGLRDAQFVEAMQFNVAEIARIFNLPAALLGAADAGGVPGTPEQDNIRFLQKSLLPWMRRIEDALRADPDLFGAGQQLRPAFVPDALLRPDTASRYDSYVKARQAGWLSANEIRALENRPPVEGGDEVQETPVGGAPNQPRVPADAEPEESSSVVFNEGAITIRNAPQAPPVVNVLPADVNVRAPVIRNEIHPAPVEVADRQPADVEFQRDRSGKITGAKLKRPEG